MRYNVATLLREPVGSRRDHEVDGEIVVDDLAQRERIVGSATFVRTKAGLLVRAHVRGRSHERCSRCLRDLEYPMSVDIDEEFQQTVDVLTGARLPPPDDPAAFLIDDQHVLDLGEAIRQYWMTMVPMQPLCRPDCPGLCPRCGHDLGKGPCDCPAEEPDERWAALAELKTRNEGS